MTNYEEVTKATSKPNNLPGGVSSKAFDYTEKPEQNRENNDAHCFEGKFPQVQDWFRAGLKLHSFGKRPGICDLWDRDQCVTLPGELICLRLLTRPKRQEATVKLSLIKKDRPQPQHSGIKRHYFYSTLLRATANDEAAATSLNSPHAACWQLLGAPP